MENKSRKSGIAGALALAGAMALFAGVEARGEAMLQFFNAKWTEIAAKAPELAEAGYTSIWLPPPAKANGGYSVGYDLFDPFDLGSTNLRDTWSTRYGTEAELHNLVETLHRFGIRVYFDNIMNHRAYDIPGFNETTPIDVYPGMVAEDFHLRRTSDGFYRKWDNCRDWNDGWQVMNLGLSDLIDIAHETPNGNHGTYEGATQPKPSIVRHPHNPEFYDRLPNGDWCGFGPDNGLTEEMIAEHPEAYREDVGAYLCRSVRWMMDTTKADGFRLDAVKHVPDYFFGQQDGDDKDRSDAGYCGNIQWQFNMTHGYSDWDNHRDTVFDTDAPRDDAMVFGEHLGSPPGLDGYIAAGMRLVDNPLRNQIVSDISSYNLWGYDNAGWGGLAPGCGVMHSQSHDNVPQSMDRRPLEQCFYMMRQGLGLFYTDGNNHAATLNGSGGAFPRWAESAYLGQWGDTRMPNLCQLNGDFGRGWQKPVYSKGDFVAWERIDGRHGGNPEDNASQVTCLVLANAGWDYGQPLPSLDSISYPHQGGGDYGSDAYLYQYADVPYVDWNPHFYTYASGLWEVNVPANAYFVFGYKNPDPSAIWAGNVIDVLEDGAVAETTPLVRTDGVDGDAAYNPYALPDEDKTDYSYTIHVPRVTKGTNVQFRVSVDGSAGDVLLRLDGGMDLNGIHHDNDPDQDLRDNPPALSDDVYLGFEGINFDQRIWPEKFAARDTKHCALGSADATTFEDTPTETAAWESTADNAGYSTAFGQPAWVWHDPTNTTDAVFEEVVTTGVAVTNVATNTYTDAASANTACSTAAIAGFGAWDVDKYANDGSSWSGWFVNATDPVHSGIDGMGTAYGLYANPDTSAGVIMKRDFTEAPADVTEFSIKLGVNWDNGPGGSYKGFELYDDEGAIFGIQIGGSAAISYYGIASGTYSSDYGTNAFTVTVARTSGGHSVTGTTRSGGTFSKNIATSRRPKGYKVYMNGCANDEGKRQMYFTDATYTAVTTNVTYTGVVTTNTVARPQLVREGTSVTVYAKSAKTNGMSAALYYTTDGSWPNGAAQTSANASTRVANGQWLATGTDGDSDWWQFDFTLPSASCTLRYKIGEFKRQGGDNGWDVVWPGSEGDVARKLPMLGQWSTIPQDLTTKAYHKHNDYNSWTTDGLPDGLHLLTARAFLNRTDGTPVYKTFRQTFMIDRETPRGELLYPDAGTTGIGGSEYGFILRTDPTVTAVYYHIEDANGDNDAPGNGTVSNAVVWGKATAAGPWTKEMAQNTQFPQLWRFTYARIPSGGSATVRIRLVESSSAPAEEWSAADPAADDAGALHFTEIKRTFQTSGDPENFYFDWPGEDGVYVEEGWNLRLNFSKKLTWDIDPAAAFKVYIQSEENASTNRGTLYSTNDIAYSFDWRGDSDEATLTFPMPNVYNGIQGWLYGVRVELVNTNAGHNYFKTATRFVTHEGARLPTVTVTTPPEVDSDGAAYVIEMADVPASVLATNAALRETPIVVQTDPAVTNVAISFLSAPAGASTALEFKGVSTNTGSLASWNWVWTVSEPGAYRFTATGWADTNGTTLTVSSNTAVRNATVQFRDIVSNSDTNNPDWDDDGILNATEHTAVPLPSGQGEYWTQAEVFAHFASGKSSDTSPDTDGDGLPDALELGYRAVQDASATDTARDSNGDGIPNFLPDYDPPFYNTTDNYNRVPYAENSSGGSSRSWMCAGSVTDPANPDSDGDGLPDGLEDANRNGWTDGDGEALPTSYDPWMGRNWPDGKMTGETWQETSPSLADSDADGLSDGYGEDNNYNGRTDMFLLAADSSRTEILLSDERWAAYRAAPDPASRAIGYSNLFAAYSVDGLNGGTAQTGGWPRLLVTETDPLCDDTDHDSLPDGWEARYGLDPLDNGAHSLRTGLAGNPRNGADGDPDGDEFTNYQEYVNGTDPTVANTIDNPGGEGVITIGRGVPLGAVNGVTNYNEFLDWSLDDLVALDNYDAGGNVSDVYRGFNDGFESSRDLVAFYFHDGGRSADGGDDKLYFRVDLLDLKAFAEENNLNVYVAVNFGNYGTGVEDFPDQVNAKSAMRWNACVGVYDSANGVLYTQDDAAGSSYSLVEHGFHGAYFNSELDSIAWSVDRNALLRAGWLGDPDALTFQVFTTRDYTGDDGGSGDKGGLNDFTDTIGDDWLCSDYNQDWDYVSTHGIYATCVGRTAGGRVWNHRGKCARVALLAHGNQAVEPAAAIQNYVNNGAGAGYHRPVLIHNIYTNCPLNLHITPTLAVALQWAGVDPASDQAWRSGPALNREIAAGVSNGNFRLLGSTYADHVLEFFPADFNAANVALAADTLDRIYGGASGAGVVSTNILWSSERVAGLATFQAIHDLGFRATVIDQTPHLSDWFERRDALGDDGYKLQRFWLEKADGPWDSLDAFAISTSAADYRYATADSGLSIELRQLFNRRARSDASPVSTLFYNWEDFASSANADAYDLCLRWIANHPWIQVVALEDVLDTAEIASHDLHASDGQSMQDWVNHACNADYANWFFGSGRHEGLAPKHFEVGAAFPSSTVPEPWGSATNGVFSNVWRAVKGIANPDVRRLALETLSASVFESAFHQESNTDLSRWSYGDYMWPASEWQGLQGFAWRAQGQTRMANIYAAVDDWAGRELSGVEAVTNLDLDLDGVAEPVLRNNAVMAVFERQGGRMVGVWLKQADGNGGTNVVQMLGNFVSIPFAGSEDEGLDNENARRAAGLTDWWNGSTNAVNLLYAVSAGASSLSFTNAALGIGKSVSLDDATSAVCRVAYRLKNSSGFYVRNGFAPDFDALLSDGVDVLSEQGSSSSSLVLSSTNAAAVRSASVAIDVSAGSINAGATDAFGDAPLPTVPMRNLAQTRQVELAAAGNALEFSLTFAAAAGTVEDPDESVTVHGVEIPVEWLETYFPADSDWTAVVDQPAANPGRKVWECYVAGLDPTDPSADLEIDIKAAPSGDGVLVSVAVPPARVATLDRTDDLPGIPGSWTPAGAFTNDSLSAVTNDFPDTPPAPARFYRVVLRVKE